VPLLVALLIWPLAAFGGTRATTAIPFGLTCVALALVTRPAIGSRLDRAWLVVLAAMALQVLPLPHHLVSVLSPHAVPVRESLAIVGARADASRFLPLTLDVGSTLWALTIVAGTAAMFAIARAQFARGGVRRTVRLIAATGFVLSLFAIAQAATAGRRIYWRFPTEFEGPLPFGPFVNRNHFATWAIMAIPLCLGYLVARTGSRERAPDHASSRTRLAATIDPRTAWLSAAVMTMLVALLLSLSRSGALALAGAGALGAAFAGRRLDLSRRRRALALVAVVALLAVAWADVGALRARFAGAQAGVSNRMRIWSETLRLAGDFPATGTGAGTYQRAMLVYQRADRSLMFNQAHNHYLQIAAEGGVLLMAAGALVIAALIGSARRRLADDASGLVWVRAGAACGLCAVGLQSLWETGLVMPANAALAAVLAAIVDYERQDDTTASR
jgi:O-antigen ligase